MVIVVVTMTSHEQPLPLPQNAAMDFLPLGQITIMTA